MYNVGFGKSEITAWEPEMAMMGWGRMDNRIVGVKEPLFTRSMAISNDSGVAVYSCIELMAVSQAIRSAVLDRLAAEHPDLGLDEHNVMFTATHTHSGPSGYSHYFFINLNGPGYSPTVFDAAVDGTVESIVKAMRRLQPATVKFGQATMPLVEPVAFNRSWFAFDANEDVEPLGKDRRDEAVDRNMVVLSAESAEGEPLGCLVWHPVHCTSVHSENDRLHSDNKGIAAVMLESDHGPEYVAVFAQEAAGDVTPNYRYDRRRKKVIGKFDNDYESAMFNGAAQARHAEAIIGEATELTAGPVHGATHYTDFSAIEVLEKYAGKPGRRTTKATLGMSMAEGTDEGPGPILGLRRLNRRLSKRRARRTDGDDPKVPMIDVGNGLDARFLGLFTIRNMRIPALEPTIRYVKGVVTTGLDDNPWVPEVLPLQLLRLGPIVVVGLPFEVTTVAGRRLRAMLESRLAGRGVEHIVINSYANAYCGYVTTFEEYQIQHYEAGYTLFGPHQLAATMTMFDWMLDRLDGAMPLGSPPPRFEQEALEARRFDTPWTMRRARPTWE